MKLLHSSLIAAMVLGTAAAHAQTTSPNAPKPDAGTSAGNSAGSAKLSQSDRDFVTKAAQAGLGEIAEAKIALRLSTRADVKSFAQRMVDDHTKAADELQRVATGEGLSLPSQPDASDSREATTLSREANANFDKDYIRAQRTAHREAVALFTRESQHGQDPALKTFASQTLPTLQAHDQMIKKMPLTKQGA